jgi:hypothetical protein
LLARERRSERVACRVGDARSYDYDRFLTTAWQAGNYLRHLGVREGVAVGVAADPISEAEGVGGEAGPVSGTLHIRTERDARELASQLSAIVFDQSHWQ